MPGEDDLASALASVASALAGEPDVTRVLERVCELAVATIEPCEHADVMVLHRRGQAKVPAATDWIGPRIVSIEAELEEGPCLEAAREAKIVRIPDHTDEPRFPNFAARCIEETPVRSSAGLNLTVGDRTYGAIDIYAHEPHAFTDEHIAVGSLFAVHAAIAVAAVRAKQDFETALASRDVIGQAKGVLMARQGIDDAAAFDMIRTASQRMNKKLRDVAERIVAEASRRS